MFQMMSIQLLLLHVLLLMPLHSLLLDTSLQIQIVQAYTIVHRHSNHRFQYFNNKNNVPFIRTLLSSPSFAITPQFEKIRRFRKQSSLYSNNDIDFDNIDDEAENDDNEDYDINNTPIIGEGTNNNDEVEDEEYDEDDESIINELEFDEEEFDGIIDDEDMIQNNLNDDDDDDETWDDGMDDDEDSNSDTSSNIEWDPDVDGVEYELIVDDTDPDSVQQKQVIDMAIHDSEQRERDENFDPISFLTNELTPEMASQLDTLPFFQQVEDLSKDIVLTDDDLAAVGINDDNLMTEVDKISDLMTDDPYPRHDPSIGQVNYLEQLSGISDDDMIELDNTYKNVQSVLNDQYQPWDKVMLRAQQGLKDLSNETLSEIDECLGEIGGSAYNVTNWLLYDLDFNVSNLILAAVQHNKDAPILFQHWYPQLVIYKRYQHARDRNFDFTWDDVTNADITELQRYYAGFGYDEIPQKAPAETGIINLDDLDEEDIKMAAFESWMTDVYNPEMDRKDFDDDTMRDEDNVFSDFYEHPQHPDLPSMEDAIDDIEQWQYENIGIDNAEQNPEIKEYRDMMGRTFDYEVIKDDEFVRDFRGHVIIACTGDDKDLEIAEKITLRFRKEFGKQVFVETRIMALAREDDNVYEIWIESYDIELLHSKKRAVSNTKNWNGPADIDDEHIEYLTNRVRFLISDDARYSYRYELDLND